VRRHFSAAPVGARDEVEVWNCITIARVCEIRAAWSGPWDESPGVTAGVAGGGAGGAAGAAAAWNCCTAVRVVSARRAGSAGSTTVPSSKPGSGGDVGLEGTDGVAGRWGEIGSGGFSALNFIASGPLGSTCASSWGCPRQGRPPL
jgi:hypothetical protein